MSRNSSGTYTLPTGNPVVAGTTIESSWANTTLSDIATEITNSLARTGAGGMTAALRLANGTSTVPGLAWGDETGTGFYRAGTSDTRFVTQTALIQQWTASGTAVTGTFSVTGNTTLGDAAGDTLTITGTAVTTPNGLNIDSDTLVVDAANDRVGVGTSSPTQKLDVDGVIRSGAGFLVSVNAGNATYVGAAGQINMGAGGNDLILASSGANVRFGNFSTNTEYMRLDASGNLGVGTSSPSVKLEVLGSSRTSGSVTAGYAAGTDNIYIGPNGAAGNGTLLVSVNYANTAYQPLTQDASLYVWRPNGAERMRLDASGNLGVGTNSPVTKLDVNGAGTVRGFLTATDAIKLGGNTSAPATTDAFIYRPADNTLAFGTASAEKMRLDSSGNLGLGVTPSAWLSSQKALEVSAWSVNASTITSSLATNAYVNASSQWIYKTNAYATRYDNVAGAHQWYTAPSGTAGNAISFTQAMTLDASGNLLVGTTTANTKVTIIGGVSGVDTRATIGNTATALQLGVDSSNNGLVSTTTANSLTFATNNTERLRITSTGAITSSDLADAVGYKGVPINSQSVNYTLVMADQGKTILHPVTDNNVRTFTIPANGAVAFPVGTVVTFINLINTVTISINSDTMYLAGTGATGSRTLAAYGVASAVKVDSTTWVISGNGLT